MRAAPRGADPLWRGGTRRRPRRWRADSGGTAARAAHQEGALGRGERLPGRTRCDRRPSRQRSAATVTVASRGTNGAAMKHSTGNGARRAPVSAVPAAVVSHAHGALALRGQHAKHAVPARRVTRLRTRAQPRA